MNKQEFADLFESLSRLDVNEEILLLVHAESFKKFSYFKVQSVPELISSLYCVYDDLPEKSKEGMLDDVFSYAGVFNNATGQVRESLAPFDQLFSVRDLIENREAISQLIRGEV